MSSFNVLFIGLLFFINSASSAPSPRVKDDQNWWKSANYYQIYPRSFQDSDGNGIGDLNGITQRLSYLKDIGITATWLSPIFKSPMVDNGYDISDFRAIDEVFGTLDDFKKLLEKAHQLGIKIILDFVPNHSSDQHEWFIKSENGDEKYKDYYVWADGKVDSVTKERKPPSNWNSVFRGSAWTWSEKRQKYYLHQFYKQQPDLNFRNPEVQKEMKDVLEFWLKLGVDGFRIDAVPHIFEDKNLRDEPRNEHSNDKDAYDYYNHIHTYDQDETFEIITEWRKVLDDYTAENGGSTRVILAEAYSSMDVKMRYYGNETHPGAQFPFNFLLLDLNENSTAKDYVGKVNEWNNKMPEGQTANWVLGNHDKPRIANRLGRKRTTLANMFILTLPGITVTYYGEELGMENIVKENETTPYYMEDERDGERSPMQWNDGVSAGFSTNKTCWLPVAPDYKTRNVKVQRKIPLSHLNQYKKLTELREKHDFSNANTFSIEAIGDSIVHVTRKSSVNFDFYFNVGKQEVLLENINAGSEVYFMNEFSKLRIGDSVSGKLYLQPNEVVILQKT